VSLLAFAGISIAAAALCIVLHRFPLAAGGVAVAGLLATSVAAASIGSDGVTVGGATIGGSPFVRLFLLLGSVAGLLLVLVSAASDGRWTLPTAVLTGLAAGGVGLGSDSLLLAVVTAGVGGIVATLVTFERPSLRNIALGGHQLRAAVVGVGLLALAIAWTAPRAGAATLPGPVVGLAYLGGVIGVALRLGVVPLHLWAARSAGVVPIVTIPVVLAWAPVLLGLPAVGWTVESADSLGFGVGTERVLVATAGMVAFLLASFAATVHEDVAHVVGYSTLGAASLVVVAMTALDASILPPLRTYVLGYLSAASAAAAWAGLLEAGFGGRRRDELAGWARRAPLLGVAAAGVLVAWVGWPGSALWEARLAIADLSAAGPLGALVIVGAVGPALAIGRWLVAGTGRPSPAVARALPLTFARPERERPRTALAVAPWLLAVIRLNVLALAAVAAAALAILAVAVSAGGLGLPAAVANP
jgi:hypothetical protein